MKIQDIYNQATTDGKVRVAFMSPTEILNEKNIETIEVNRDVNSRLDKMKKIFKSPTQTQRSITIFNVKQNMEINLDFDTVSVLKGFKLSDGNTRRKFWLANPDIMKENLLVTFIDIDNEQDYLREYYSIDSSNSVESMGNKITGAINLLSMDLRTRKAQRGQFGEAIKYAYPGDVLKDSVLKKVAYFKNEIEQLDKVGLFDPADKAISNAGAALLSAFLIAQKLYAKPNEQRAKLLDGMRKLANLESESYQQHNHRDAAPGRMDGMLQIIHESIHNTRIGEAYGSTKRAHMPIAISFYLYCIEKWMTNQHPHVKNGFKKWERTYDEVMLGLREDFYAVDFD